MSDRHLEKSTVRLDCDEGRRRGCATFCCRLIVRYTDDEVVFDSHGRRKSCVDKNPDDGLCVHSDRTTGLCRVFETRPRVCRAYDCNTDPLLGVVLRDGFRTLTALLFAEPSAANRGGKRFLPILDDEADNEK